MTKKLFISIILLLLAAGITTWLALQSIKKNSKYYIDKPHTPDAYATNITYMQTNSDGYLNNIIYSTKLSHYSYHNATIFQKPIIKIINPKAKPYLITAEMGHSLYGTKIIYLTGKVKLNQPAGPNNKKLTITTEAATIYLSKKYITTNNFVTIKQPGLITTAIGASDDLIKKILTLHSQVKELYFK